MQNASDKHPTSIAANRVPSGEAESVLPSAETVKNRKSGRVMVKARIVTRTSRKKAVLVQQNPAPGGSAWWNF